MATIIGIDPAMVKRTTCRECASIIEYTRVETTVVLVRDYTGDSEQERRLTCPNCQHPIRVFLH